jgi:hypothetical protein
MPSVIERLVKLSEGFPFLAEELLREAKVELASSMLGSSREPAALRDAGSSTKRSTVSTDPYTDDELVALNEFYSTYKRNSGWELFKVTDGVEYFSRPGEGNIRQSKASCIIPNATPHDLLDTIVRAQLDKDHWTTLERTKRGATRTVLEKTSDHSAVVSFTIPFPSPIQDRESVQRCVWKEMEPGKILFLARSVEHEKCPRSRRYVRMHVQYRAYVLTEIPNMNSTREELLLMADPGVSGYPPNLAVPLTISCPTLSNLTPSPVRRA